MVNAAEIDVKIYLINKNDCTSVDRNSNTTEIDPSHREFIINSISFFPPNNRDHSITLFCKFSNENACQTSYSVGARGKPPFLNFAVCDCL